MSAFWWMPWMCWSSEPSMFSNVHKMTKNVQLSWHDSSLLVSLPHMLLLSLLFQVRSLWRSSLRGPRGTHGSWSSSNWTWGPASGSWSSSRRRNPDPRCTICLVLTPSSSRVSVDASERDWWQIIEEEMYTVNSKKSLSLYQCDNDSSIFKCLCCLFFTFLPLRGQHGEPLIPCPQKDKVFLLEFLFINNSIFVTVMYSLTSSCWKATNLLTAISHGSWITLTQCSIILSLFVLIFLWISRYIFKMINWIFLMFFVWIRFAIRVNTPEHMDPLGEASVFFF